MELPDALRAASNLSFSSGDILKLWRGRFGFSSSVSEGLGGMVPIYGGKAAASKWCKKVRKMCIGRPKYGTMTGYGAGARRRRRPQLSQLPDANVEQQQIRCILIRMMLDLHSLVTAQGRPVEEMVVAFAIRLGQYEGKLMDATQIATVTTLPRTSVRRHLSIMLVKGRVAQTRVGRRQVYFFKNTSPQADAFFADAESIVRTCTTQLAKMATSRSRHRK